MIRKLIVLAVLVLVLSYPMEAMSQGASFIDPELLQSGVEDGEGSDEADLFIVPDDFVFVLTDLNWTPILLPDDGEDRQPESWFALVEIQDWTQGAMNGLRWSGEAFHLMISSAWTGSDDATVPQPPPITEMDHRWPIGFHSTTGIVFDEGSVVGLEVGFNFWDDGGDYMIDWFASWSGYLYPKLYEEDGNEEG